MHNRVKMYADTIVKYVEIRRTKMAFIIDRLILILLSVILLAFEVTLNKIIIFGLVAIIIAGLCYFVDEKKITGIIGIIYLIGNIYYPELLLIAPVATYELFANKLFIELIIMLLFLFINLSDISIVAAIIIVFFSLLACILNYRSKENERLNALVKHIRDDSEERTILLAEKNKHLIEKQDQEVYVATLKERNRIAREIHDNVGHMITRSILQMGALMTINKEEPLHGQLESVKNNLDVAMNNIRESVHDLHDESVDLKQSILELVAELEGRFDCRLDYDASKDIERKYKYAIIGIVKEAVSNILKHSKNDKVDIILREHPGMIQLIIHDYNRDKSATYKTLEEIQNNSDGIGLGNMQDRVKALRGNISIETDRGFRIFVTLPRN